MQPVHEVVWLARPSHVTLTLTLTLPVKCEGLASQTIHEGHESDGAAIDEGGSSSHIDDIARRSFSDLKTKIMYTIASCYLFVH